MTSGCSEWFERLSARLDGALTPEESEAARGHLAACAACDRRLRSMRALKHAVARLPSREAPPGAVRAHVESLVFSRRRSRRRLLALQVLLAASVAVAIWASVAVRRPAEVRSARLADELAADHLHSVPEAMPAEVATGDPAEVVRFFSGRVSFTPIAPHLEGARLVGARLCKIEGRRVQLLFYRHGSDSTLSLFVAGHDSGPASGCQEARGLAVCSRTSRGLTLHLVGTGARPDLQRLLETATLKTGER
jgi:anti-sigma factor RsiW